MGISFDRSQCSILESLFYCHFPRFWTDHEQPGSNLIFTGHLLNVSYHGPQWLTGGPISSARLEPRFWMVSGLPTIHQESRQMPCCDLQIKYQKQDECSSFRLSAVDKPILAFLSAPEDV
jgi:hypothetical protein